MPYAERSVRSRVACCSREQTTTGPLAQRVVPDACVDLLWCGVVWCGVVWRSPDRRRARYERVHRVARGPDALVAAAAAALDRSSQPGCRTRALVGDAALEAHLDAVEAVQEADGGWTFDWLAWSPAQTSAWRGVVTMRAPVWRRDNGRGP